MSRKRGWIGVDLDGTLAEYHGWDGGKIGPPIPAMAERVKRWVTNGWTVKIMTARVSGRDLGNGEIRFVESKIREWCLTHLGFELEVTCMKDFSMLVLYDDRAMAVQENTGEVKGWRDTFE